jgi:phosphoserine phosphatase RsbU/P
MTGLLTIGAAHALAAETSDPAVLLERLNREICRHHREGFITFICARISTDGAVTIANAGHLSPYRNSEESPLKSGLPLGLISGVEYPEATMQLSPGDTFTLLSDGVVEAQSASGELFGFDRTRAIIYQPPAAIAEAARAYGQSDDITVLAVTFVPAEVPA